MFRHRQYHITILWNRQLFLKGLNSLNIQHNYPFDLCNRFYCQKSIVDGATNEKNYGCIVMVQYIKITKASTRQSIYHRTIDNCKITKL